MSNNYQVDMLFSMLNGLMSSRLDHLGQDHTFELLVLDHVFYLLSRHYTCDLNNLYQFGILSKLPYYLESGHSTLHEKTVNIIGMVA